MANGGFLYNNLNKSVTPVASTTATGYSILDAVDGYPSTYHRSAGTSLTVKWNFGSATAIVGAAIVNHNIPVGATVDLEWSNDDFANVLATEHMVAQAADMFLSFSLKSYQYVRYNITVSSGYIQVGEFCIYQAKYQPARNYSWEYQRIKQICRYQSEAGGQITKKTISRRSGFVIPFYNMPAADQDSLAVVLEKENVLFMPDFDVQECYHGALVEDIITADVSPAFRHKYKVRFMQNAVKI
jgi:hypothetical protein